jgi:hypothetical protein
MTKDARTDPKFHEARVLLSQMDHVMRNAGPRDKTHPLLWRRMRSLRDLRLPFPVVKRLNARLVVRRALATGSDALIKAGTELLQQWQDVQNPAHETNSVYRFRHSAIYTRVCQRNPTRPLPIPTNRYRGLTMDLKPSVQEKGRLFDYGLDCSEDEEDMDCGFGDISSIHTVPGSGCSPSEFSCMNDDSVVPELNRALNEISADSASHSILGSSAATAFYDSAVHDMTLISQEKDFRKGVAEALDKHSYPVVSTPRWQPQD